MLRRLAPAAPKAGRPPPASSCAAGVLLKEVLDRAKEVGFTSLALTADFSWVRSNNAEAAAIGGCNQRRLQP